MTDISSLISRALAGLMLSAALLGTGCGSTQAYPGPTQPSYKTATIAVNPPQANIGFQLSAVNDRPINADVSASILPGSTKLTLTVWPTSSTTFQESDPAFATHYQMIDQRFKRMMTITFDAVAGGRYGLSGQFNQGATPAESNYSINVFDQETKAVLARVDSDELGRAAEDKVQAGIESQAEQWTVEEGPGS